MIYKFTISESYTIDTGLIGRSDLSNDLIDFKNGVLTLKRPFSWDGCSPKIKFSVNGKSVILGTWDGRLIKHANGKGLPQAYYACLVHDLIYKFKKEIDISRAEADLLFKKMLDEVGFEFSWMYYQGVKFGGGIYGDWLRAS